MLPLPIQNINKSVNLSYHFDAEKANILSFSVFINIFLHKLKQDDYLNTFLCQEEKDML